MWSVHVIPNNGTSCLASEEEYQTHVMVRKKNASGGCHAKHFSSKNAPFYECYKNNCLVTIFAFKLLFLSISEHTLLI